MNRYTLLLTFLLSLVSFPSLGVDFDDLVKRDGLYYEKFSNVPFTGKVTGGIQGSLKKGLREGEWVYYHRNGQLHAKGTFKNGKEDGEWILYHQNGHLDTRGTMRNGKKEGEWISYHRDGRLVGNLFYENGELMLPP